MREIPEMLHRTFFRTLSLMAPRRQGVLLRGYFDWWHRRPDPWNLGTDDYERYKYLTTLKRTPARPYSRILDVGCSEGVFTRYLADAYPGAEVVGMDISARAIERARALHGARASFVQADILGHPPAHRFDLVFCAETLYYIGRGDRLRRASARLGALLRPGGLLVLTHPWPEAERLHGYFDEDSTLSRVDEHVDGTTHRPFAVALYQSAPHPAGNAATHPGAAATGDLHA
ncbi:class I SAM-dependent methyltransferase [Sphaerisporangium sp. TRM90804]|uniref:class I SAM-dependent methyltransferase n=1 Tax=Sphaerisporangium sp. TRM90804 TaxID=3031113 RepID=UPI00244C18CD|nr:class I SAM-dependent methyltransferase [Sphaerisporangium sp. TRM90804]MDH2430740.1 class I SAM-dependent methyltransferase [Sphaerisporangium sp. TRM90804]